MRQVLLSASVVVVSSSSQCDGFNTLDGMKCDGLTKYPEIADQETCKSSCCADASCDTWHWCDSTSCLGWGGAKCWYGTASSCTETKKWVGESKSAPAPTPTPSPPPPTPSPPPSPSPPPAPPPVPSPPSPVTRKRGFSGYLGENMTCADAEALNLQDSWYYSWNNGQGQLNHCGGMNLTAEFVPMIIGAWIAKKLDMDKLIPHWQSANVRYLLGYNEPDTGNGHNHPHMIAPAQAAIDWPQLQKISHMFDPPLELVGPAVASTNEKGGGDAWDEDGRSTWLDDFLGNCTSEIEWCYPEQIKYIAMHDYHCDVNALKRRIEGAYQRYGRKIWLTEVACTTWGAPPSRETQDAYMRELLPYLDSSPHVFRYNWFSARNAPNEQNGGSNLLPWDSTSTEPTSTGRIYATPETSSVFV